MIAITSSNGMLLRSIPFLPEEYGYHSTVGFGTLLTIQERLRLRRKLGLSDSQRPIDFRFGVDGSEKNFTLKAIENCGVEKISDTHWKIVNGNRSFLLVSNPTISYSITSPPAVDSEWKWGVAVGILPLFFLLISLFFKEGASKINVPTILEPITVKVVSPLKNVASVKVPELSQMPKLVSEVVKAGKTGGAAVQQNLGFLSLVGSKNLKKALGGPTTTLKEATPGAGPGGKQGSGGELLVGLGEGVKKTTVGNSGVAGLGGLGTKGTGGGEGGYGNAWIGSGGTGNGLNGIGNGRSLSMMSLSQDMILEGGLDSSVIQATIAKYLNQIRACYEEGLRQNPGLSGQVTMQFEIGATGKINYSRVGRSSLGNLPVENCISSKMMTWQFPEPMGGVNVKVSYPFLLRPVNS